MASIAKTTLATSDPVDICRGFALFPALGTARAAVSTKGGRYHLLSMSPSCIFGRLRVNVDYDIFVGICGPAYAIRFDAEGSNTGSRVDLTLSNDVLAAGILTGVTLTPTVKIGVDKPVWKWVRSGWFGHFEQRYEQAFGTQISIPLDVINLLAVAIEWLLEKNGKTDTALKKVNSLTPNLISSWGIYAEEKNKLGTSSDGKARVEPKFMLQFNIVPLVPALKAADTAMKAVLGTIRLGPTLGPSIPTTVQVSRIGINGRLQNDTSYDPSTRTVTGTGGSASETATSVNVELKHTAGFDIRVGVFFTIKVLKLLGTTVENDVGLLRLMGITPAAGPYTNTLQSNVGQRAAAAPAEAARKIKVVFGQPEAATA